MTYRLIIAGSRDMEDKKYKDALERMIDAFINLHVPEGEEIILLSGCCRGIDLYGEFFAHLRGWKVERHPADWKTHGRAAGPIRNQQMIDKADGVIVLCYEDSKGSNGLVKLAEATNVDLLCIRIPR